MKQSADPLSPAPLPYATAGLPGIGGRIKQEPGHFSVEEIPLYEPSGSGEHVYVRLTREGWTTRRLQQELARLFDLRERDVGYAGLKDKDARATQTFSLLLHGLDDATVSSRIEQALPAEVLWVRRHGNKLKPGHLRGNRFQIVLALQERDVLHRAEGIARQLQADGLPNFYGPQRFGVGGRNAELGWEVLRGAGPRERWLRRFLLSAYQSALFNTWLAERIHRGWSHRLLKGDIAKKTDTGGLFEVEDITVDSQRFQRQEIIYTGPIYGHRMRWATGEPGTLEQAILEQAGATLEALHRARLVGGRRQAIVLLDDLQVEPLPDGLLLSFCLPKGAYATTVLREFMKSEPVPGQRSIT